MPAGADHWNPLDAPNVQGALGRIDPLPAGLLDRLGAVFALRRRDAELARLADEGPVVALGDTSSARPRNFRFESTRCTVDIVVAPGRTRVPGGLELTGEVQRATPWAVIVDTAAGTVEGVVDGRSIRVDAVDYGPARICLVMDGIDDPWVLETEWITI